MWGPSLEVEIIGREEIEEVEKAGRPPGRPVYTTCTGIAQSTARSTVARSGRPHGRPTESRLLSVLVRIPFLFGIESNWGFLKPRDSVAINKG